MSLIQLPTLYSAKIDHAEDINSRLLTGLIEHLDDDRIKKTHFFNGRYENIYIDAEIIPEIDVVLKTVVGHAASILHMPEDQLKAGLWFNAMGLGQITTAHTHDDDDELLSAVYYVKIPPESGRLILRYENFTTEVEPEEGMFVFFPPNLMHEVSENHSPEMRLSLGINIGPR